ncbi:hypothetical protein GN958_ATG10171 [Phytophthora infestans]|uniref:Uncharacterized protein n=1 Tax=Phytophthora infestans TaxID=4787 RepID=A0A8S9UMI3_PHYIN|nr:hypothetical protein GN958_ATG10171 [Phytophthora infestans]
MEDLGARALSCGNFSGEKIAFIGSSSSRPHTESTGTSTMPRGKKLSEKEIGRVKAHVKDGKSKRWIHERLAEVRTLPATY